MDLRIRWTAFPLHPETPDDGRTLEALFAGRGMDIAGMLAHLKATAESLGLPFGERRMTFNSRRAQEMGKWAETHNRGETFHRAVFHAYFAKGRNIARPDVLLDVAASVGLEPVAAQEILDTRSFGPAVDEDWQRAYQMGIRAVPTFHMNGRQLVGAQSYQTLEQFVQGI